MVEAAAIRALADEAAKILAAMRAGTHRADPRDIGQMLNGKWDQDFVTALLAAPGALCDEVERLRAERDSAVSTLEEIADVGSGYGGRKIEEAKFSYSTTTGEGHQECRQLADATLAAIRARKEEG